MHEPQRSKKLSPCEPPTTRGEVRPQRDVAIAYQVVGEGPRRRVRPRHRRGLALHLGAASARPPCRRAGGRLRARADARQAWGRPLGSRPGGAVARNDDGRCASRDGCCRLGPGCPLHRLTSTGIGVLFAATYPDRCAGLVLIDPRSKGIRTSEYPWAPTEEEWREQLAAVRAGWGERVYLEGLAREWAPEVADDDAFCDWFVWHMRRSLSPGAALTSFRTAMELDVRDVLAAIRVPTLVFPRSGVPGPGYYAADRIRDRGGRAAGYRGVYTGSTTLFIGDDGGHQGFVSRLTTIVGRSECWRRFCSPTSSAQPSSPRRSATRVEGAAPAASRHRPAGVRPLPGPRARYGWRWLLRRVRRARSRRSRRFAIRDALGELRSQSGRDSIPASARWPTARSRASRSRSGHASQRSPNRARCWSRARSRISSLARTSVRGSRRAPPQRHPGPWRLFA